MFTDLERMRPPVRQPYVNYVNYVRSTDGRFLVIGGQLVTRPIVVCPDGHGVVSQPTYLVLFSGGGAYEARRRVPPQNSEL